MNKSGKWKPGLFYGIFMGLFFIGQHLLEQDGLTAKNITISIVSGIIGGVIGGFLFGWLVGRFTKSKSVALATKIDTRENEIILFETPANHFKGAEGVGGKLYLTDQRLVFKSHKFNIQNHELSIPLSGIDNTSRYKTLGLVNNGLAITTCGKVEKFVVQQVDEWMHKLAEKTNLQPLHLQ